MESDGAGVWGSGVAGPEVGVGDADRAGSWLGDGEPVPLCGCCCRRCCCSSCICMATA